MTSSAEVSRLIGDIYDAALDASRWQGTLGNLVEALDGRAGHLLMAGTGRLPQNLVSANFAPDETLRYNAYYCGLDPVAPLLVTTPVGAIVTCRDQVPVHTRESEFYRDWASPNEVGDGIFVNIENDERGLCALVVARPWLSKPIGTPWRPGARSRPLPMTTSRTLCSRTFITAACCSTQTARCCSQTASHGN
jgi:hypothetical protein